MSPVNSDPSPSPEEGQTVVQTSSEQDAITAPASTTDKPRSTNLHDDPNVRRLQASYEKRLADQQRQLAELQAKEEARKLEGMDDLERLQYENEQLKQRVAQREQAEEIESSKRKVLTDLQQRSGVPVDVLAEAESAYDAALLALEYVSKGKVERKEANQVDLGGGRANTPADRIELAAREAMQNGDAAAYVRLLREARET